MKRLLWILLSGLPAGLLQAQQPCGPTALQEAERQYNIGRFAESSALLNGCIRSGGLDYGNKLQAYRLLALNSLAQDSMALAESSIISLLQLKDNYEYDTRDPERFRQELIRIKAGQRISLVSSVSKKAEDIRRAPANITVITKEQIQQRGYSDLIEVLSDVAGFDISIAYGVNYAAVYQRGLRTTITEKTLLLVDGIEENDLWSNVADISRQYSLTNIKRIEIIYGPASTMYGANAFIGVINIITKESDDVVRTAQNKTIGLHANAGYGSFNTRYADVTVGYQKELFKAVFSMRAYDSERHDMSSQRFFDFDPSVYDNINYRTNLSVRTNATAYVNQNNLPAASPWYTIFRNGAVVDSIIPTQAGLLRAAQLDKQGYNSSTIKGGRVGWANPATSYLVNARISVGSFTLGYQRWLKKEGAGTLYTDQFAAINDVFWIPDRSYFYAKYDRQLNNTLQFSSLSSFRIHKLNNDTRVSSVVNYARGGLRIKDLATETPAFYNTSYFFQNSTQFRQELKMLWTPLQNFYLLSGAEYRSSQLQGDYLISLNAQTPEEFGVFAGDQKGGNQFNLSDIGVYTQANYRFKNQIGLTAGVRVDNNRIRQNGGFGTVITSRLVADYALRDWVFKAIYSSGIQNASNFTKFSTASGRIPNPGLGTEDISNFELYISKRFSRNFEADINFFNAQIRNVVGVVILAPGQSQNRNTGAFNLNGFQSNLMFRKGNFSANANATFNKPRQKRADDGKPVDLRVGDIAGFRVIVILNYLAFKRLNFNLRANVAGNRPTGAGTSVPLNPETFGGYQQWNGAVTYQNLLPGLHIQLCGNNLFNTVIYHTGVRAADGVSSPSSLLQPGINGFVKFNYEF